MYVQMDLAAAHDQVLVGCMVHVKWFQCSKGTPGDINSRVLDAKYLDKFPVCLCCCLPNGLEELNIALHNNCHR